MGEKTAEIDHVGIATRDLDKSSIFWELLGFKQNVDDEIVDEQGVKVRYLSSTNKDDNTKIELLEPTGDETPIGKFLSKFGPGIQQLCVRVSNIESILEELSNSGILLIDQEPRVGAHGAKIAFIHPKSTGGVLVELTEY